MKNVVQNHYFHLNKVWKRYSSYCLIQTISSLKSYKLGIKTFKSWIWKGIKKARAGWASYLTKNRLQIEYCSSAYSANIA